MKIPSICLPFLLSIAVAAQVSGDQPKNVLLLIADDMNTWVLGDENRYAGKTISPNLKALAASGVNFAHAYSASPVCSPSRTAILSGMAPWVTGHYQNALDVTMSEPLNNQAITFPGLFKKAGYSTFSYGKIAHGWDQKEYWDENVGHKRDKAPPGAPLTPAGRGENDWGLTHLDESEMNTTLLANMAIAQLEKEHDKPFLLTVGSFLPHMPWYVPQKYLDMFPIEEVTTPPTLEGDLDDVPERGKVMAGGKTWFVEKIMQHGIHKEGVQAYLATIAYVDYQMGRILDALEKSPYADNTIVIFMSDHGFHLAEKGHWQKGTLWEEATHSMFMIKAPGVSKAGGVSERFVSLLDLYPTLAELCDLDAPDYLDGRSLVPLLKDPAAAWESTAISTLSKSSMDEPDRAYLSIRNELGRYINYQDGQEEFYDKTKDPNEWHNQIDNPEYASVIEKMRAALPQDFVPPLEDIRLRKALEKKRAQEKK